MSQDPNDNKTGQVPQINGDESIELTDQIDASALGVPQHDNAILNTLPGLTGALDQAFQEQVGKKVAFVLVAFAESGAAYTTNIDGAHNMRDAMRKISPIWDEPKDALQ